MDELKKWLIKNEYKLGDLYPELSRIYHRMILENLCCRKALDFYADDGNWKYLDVMYDKGEIARQARKGE